MFRTSQRVYEIHREPYCTSINIYRQGEVLQLNDIEERPGVL